MGLIEQGKPVEETKLWQLFHAVFFLIGGWTFVFGTAAYYYPDWEAGPFMGGLLYTIGSSGFLGVDLMEFFTYTKDGVLRINIALSAIGSLLYVIGSVGFLPAVYESGVYALERMGVDGFIAGSFFIGVSQFWKTYRILSMPNKTKNEYTACGVELGAGLGAWCFFVGTIMYDSWMIDDYFNLIINIWEAGSCLFTSGALFLTYRHFVMDLA